MSNQQTITELIKRISGQANTLIIPRVYISLLDGDITAALLLSQIVYWSDKGKRADGGFWKTYKEWEEELSLTQYQVNRATKKLIALGVLKTALKRANGAPTVHYYLQSGLLTNSIIKFLDNRETQQSDYKETAQSDSEETQQTLTDTTAESTQEITDPSAASETPAIALLSANDLASEATPLLDMQSSAKTIPSIPPAGLSNAVDPYQAMAEMVERLTGYPTLPGDTAALAQMVKLEIIEEDIQAALEFFSGNGKTARGAKAILESAKYSRAKRIQSANAKAPAWATNRTPAASTSGNKITIDPMRG